MDKHTQTPAGLADFASGITTEFTVETWFSGADLKVKPGSTWPFGDAGNSRRQYVDVYPYDKLGMTAPQYTLWSLAEPNATAGWPDEARDYMGLSGACHRKHEPDWTEDLSNYPQLTHAHGLGLALVINVQGCPQLIFGKRYGAYYLNEYSCLTIPLHTDGGCCRGSRWENECLPRYLISEANAGFNVSAQQTFMDSVVNDPTTSHHIVVVVRSLSKATWEKTAANKSSWEIWIDGVLHTSAVYKGGQVANNNGDQQEAELALPSTPVSLGDIVTPTMRLTLGSDGYKYNSFEKSGGDLYDIALSAEYPNRLTGTTKRYHVTRPPRHNAHPFSGVVEKVAMYKRALEESEVMQLFYTARTNRPPQVVEGQTVDVIEDECSPLAIASTDPDNDFNASNQLIHFQLEVNDSSVYSDASCLNVAAVGSPHAPLYFKSATTHFHGSYGSIQVRAFDGEAPSLAAASVEINVKARPDAPEIYNSTAEVDALGSVEITFPAYDIDLHQNTTNFRLQVTSLPMHGQLYDTSPFNCSSCTPLSVSEITSGPRVFYQSNTTAISVNRIALVDFFIMTGISPLPNLIYSSVSAFAAVGQITALAPVTTQLAGLEDQPFDVVLQARYPGPIQDVSFRIVGVEVVQLYQADGSLVTGATSASPVVANSVTSCGTYLYCSSFRAEAPSNFQGRRLSAAAQPSLSYQVLVLSFVSEIYTANITIPNTVDPVAVTPPSTVVVNKQLTFEPRSYLRISPPPTAMLQNFAFNDPDDGADWIFLSASTTNHTFYVEDTLKGLQDTNTNPPSADKFHWSGIQVHKLLGFCPSVCTTVGTECQNCLSGSDITSIKTFQVVFRSDLLRSVADSIKMSGYGETTSTDAYDTLVVRVLKVNAASPGGVEYNATSTPVYITIGAQYDTYAEEGYCRVWQGHTSYEYTLEFVFCYLFNLQGAVWYFFLTGNTHQMTVLSWAVVVVISGILTLLGALCCVGAFAIATARAGQFTVGVLKKADEFFDQQEEEDRGVRRKQSFPAFVCQWITCYGCCGFFAWMCRPGRVKDPTWTDRIKGLFYNLTCRTIPQLKPNQEEWGGPRLTWGDRFHECYSWLMCRGCGVVPALETRIPQEQPEQQPRSSMPLIPLRVQR